VRDFFISYNKADKPWAEWIDRELRAAGCTTVIQANDFGPGCNFILEMQKATEEAERTIAVLSPAYLGALYTQPEWAAAFAKDPTGEKRLFVPIRVAPCQLKGMLANVVYMDLVGLDEAAAREALLDCLLPSRQPGKVKGAFPGAAGTKAPRFPGALPPIWNVPHRRNPNFTGREEELAELSKTLAKGGTAALTQAITGLGGVGKTQLAIEYVYRHVSDYGLIWWVGAEVPAKRAADFAALAAPLDLREKDSANQPEIVGAVRRELGRRTRWLLVFDDAGAPEDLADYLPQGTAGHVVVTSRNPAWASLGKPLPVKTLPRPESVQFLLKRSGDEDGQAADALAEALGDLPLALEHAAAYVEQKGCTLAHYLDLYEKQGKELRRRANAPAGYTATVATTWEISLGEAEKASPAAAELLNLCAFLAPDGIPLDILREQAAKLPKRLAQALREPLKLDEALAALRRYSLVEVAGDALSIHRLVQTVARDRLGTKEWRAFAAAAIEAINSAFPLDSDDVRNWPQCSRLLAHALASASHAEAENLAPASTGRLLNQAGMYLLGRAAFPEAKAAFGRALPIFEAALGKDHPNVATLVNNLGRVLQDMGDLAGAKRHFERALAIDEAAFGPNHPSVATDINNLGSVHRDMGDLEGAKRHFERALPILEAALNNSPRFRLDIRKS